ncbi:MAG: phosphate regulon sensor histidine kinase PhoR [Candidatus Polarisedimenticolaceae bacterium]|nr:phosphate regulon sensor histidine kinase PhoR [Candidatus Polarisedimenticolaceae bacterium]
MSNILKDELLLTAPPLLIGALVGWLANDIALGIAATLLTFSARHFHQLILLNKLISNGKEVQKPYPTGLWGKIYREKSLQQKQNNKLKQNLKQFVTNFQEASTAISDALITLDQENRISWANPAAETLLNIHWPSDSGQLLTDKVDYLFLETYLQQSDFSRPLEFSLPNNQNAIISLQVTSFGKMERQHLVVVREITQLFHLNQARRNFVSSVSHELKTPLTVLVGFLEALNDAETLAHQDRPLELMQQQAARMQLLVDDLLILSRLEIESKTIDEEPLAIGTLITEVIEEAKLLSDAQRHQFKLKIDESLSLHGNRQEIRSSFSNLLTNAVKYSSPNSTISIIWAKNSVGPYFSVSDQGDGIAERHLSRLTERFYRVDTGRSRESGGTGLGLAIVKHALYRHDAELKISSKIGVGSTFCCQFHHSRAIY